MLSYTIKRVGFLGTIHKPFKPCGQSSWVSRVSRVSHLRVFSPFLHTMATPLISISSRNTQYRHFTQPSSHTTIALYSTIFEATIHTSPSSLFSFSFSSPFSLSRDFVHGPAKGTLEIVSLSMVWREVEAVTIARRRASASRSRLLYVSSIFLDVFLDFSSLLSRSFPICAHFWNRWKFSVFLNRLYRTDFFLKPTVFQLLMLTSLLE